MALNVNVLLTVRQIGQRRRNYAVSFNVSDFFGRGEVFLYVEVAQPVTQRIETADCLGQQLSLSLIVDAASNVRHIKIFFVVGIFDLLHINGLS